MKRSPPFTVGATALLLFGIAGSAGADVVMLGNTGFPVAVSTGVGLTFNGLLDPSKPLGVNSPWTVTETYTYTSVNPIILDYKYVGNGGQEPMNGDYYFLVSEDLVNNSGSGWGGYRWEIADNNGSMPACCSMGAPGWPVTSRSPTSATTPPKQTRMRGRPSSPSRKRRRRRRRCQRPRLEARCACSCWLLEGCTFGAHCTRRVAGDAGGLNRLSSDILAVVHPFEVDFGQ